MKALICKAGLVLGCLSTTATASAVVKSVQLNGSGCPNSAPHDFHWEGDELVINFDKMVVEKGGGRPLTEGRKNCSLILDFEPGSGEKFSLSSFSIIAFASLHVDDKAKLTLSGFRQGSAQTSVLEFEVHGQGNKKDHDINYGYTVADKEKVWTPCQNDRALNLNTAINVTRKNGLGDRNAESFAALDLIRFRFARAACP